MSHEQSETIERDGRYYNIYGRATKRAGQPLAPLYPFERPWYRSLDEAVAAARKRSELGGEPIPEEDSILQKFRTVLHFLLNPNARRGGGGAGSSRAG